MALRGTCWSITINNPTKEDEECIAKLRNMPWFVAFTSQNEVGAEGTPHIQGMLRTSQQRFAAVKKALPRAHIELAKNAAALTKYVSKAETRVSEREEVSRDIPTLFEYQTRVAYELTEEKVFTMSAELNIDTGEAALKCVDAIVSRHIAEGGRGLEFIGINPMWRSSWKKFWRSIITRDGSHRQKARHQTDEGREDSEDAGTSQGISDSVSRSQNHSSPAGGDEGGGLGY